MKIHRLLFVFITASAIVARGDTFTIDPTMSSLTISGSNFFAGAFVPQGPNSLTTTYSGTIDASFNASTVMFNSGAVAAAISGSWQPGAGGVAGSAPADYGVAFAGFPAFAAVRNFVLNLSSGAIALTGGAFDATQITVGASSGNADYTGPLGSGTVDLTTLGSGMNMAMPGSLTMNGGVATLTIPIQFSETFTVVSTNDTTATFTGTIVATEIVPEPSSATLALVGLLGAGGLWLAQSLSQKNEGRIRTAKEKS